MASFLNLFVIGSALLAVAHGASLATTKDNCTMNDGFQALSCVIRMTDFAEKIDELDMDSKEELKEFKRSCDSLQKCFSGIKCNKMYSEAEELSTVIKSYCDAVLYVSNEFAGCSDKLEKNKSKCFDDWDPFPNNVDEEKDEKKKAELQKAACKNFFGKDNCLKKEITETCSEKEWIDFKNHFVGLNAMMKQCEDEVYMI